MAKVKKLYLLIQKFIKKLGDDGISAYAAETAFFLIISFFPFVMLLITLLEFLPITENVLNVLAERFLPEMIGNFASQVITELAERANKTVISITALATLWSASRGSFSVVKGLNVAFGVEETRGYIILRVSSVLYTFVFAVTVLLTLVLLVFGSHIFEWFANKFVFLKEYAFLLGSRQVIGFIMLSLFFAALYVFAPNRKTKLKEEILGAVFTAIGWMLFSFAFSFYINNAGNFSYFYGSLTSVVVLMLWLYICMYIVFIGAEINVFLREEKEKTLKIKKI